jgi:hypothetical protein
VFEHWPHNFHQFLDKKSKGDVRFNPRDGKLDTVLKEEFGALFKRLYSDLRGHQFNFLRKAFAQFLTNRLRAQYEGGSEGKVLLTEFPLYKISSSLIVNYYSREIRVVQPTCPARTRVDRDRVCKRR